VFIASKTSAVVLASPQTIVNMFLRSALLSLSALVAAKEMPKDEVKGAELYDTGIRHANNMALKHVSFSASPFLYDANL
jgi:hypothetical protein